MSIVVTRDVLLAATERPKMPAEIPGVGTVMVQGMIGTERDAFEKTIVGKDGKLRMASFRAALIIACAINPDGTPMFTADDARALRALPAVNLEPIVNVAMKLSGISEADAAELGKD